MPLEPLWRCIGTTKDERTVYIFALRYALPRQTYAMSIVSEQIMARIADMEAENRERVWIPEYEIDGKWGEDE